MDADLPIHFFTLALNAMPFIRYHLPVFQRLPFRWHWTIVEGLALPGDDCAWLKTTGRGKQPCNITTELHHDFLSVDGTTEYLSELAWRSKENGKNVTVIRNPVDRAWRSKLEACNAALPKEPCLLWQVDADELWRTDQIIEARNMFIQNPNALSAFYSCQFFVGPRLIIQNRETYGNHAGCDWQRTWRFSPGMEWLCHAPPVLDWTANKPRLKELYFGHENRFLNAETEAHGLVFQHFAYAIEQQARFKELYYGYTNVAAYWRALQRADMPCDLSHYLPWVEPGCTVSTADCLHVVPLHDCSMSK